MRRSSCARRARGHECADPTRRGGYFSSRFPSQHAAELSPAVESRSVPPNGTLEARARVPGSSGTGSTNPQVTRPRLGGALHRPRRPRPIEEACRLLPRRSLAGTPLPVRARSDAAGIQHPRARPRVPIPPIFRADSDLYEPLDPRPRRAGGSLRRRNTGGGAGAPARGQQGNNMSMLRYYTDDSPGLKITPVRSPFPPDREDPRHPQPCCAPRNPRALDRSLTPSPRVHSLPAGRGADDERVLHRFRHHAPRRVQDLPVPQLVSGFRAVKT